MSYEVISYKKRNKLQNQCGLKVGIQRKLNINQKSTEQQFLLLQLFTLSTITYQQLHTIKILYIIM